MTILVLGGGGLWSAAGVGVLQALEEMHVPIDGIVGSSAGAFIGALACEGYRPDEIFALLKSLRPADFPLAWKSLGSIVRGRWPSGILDRRHILRRLAEELQVDDFDELEKPLWVVATSLTQRGVLVMGPEGLWPEETLAEELAITRLSLSLPAALWASSAVPGVFSPIEVSGHVLVDAGVLDDYPVDVAAVVGADHIIGVWVDEAPWHAPETMHIGHLMMQSVSTMIHELSRLRQRLSSVPRVDIRIQMEGGHRVFNRVPDIVRLGYDKAWLAESELKAWRV